MRRPQTSQERQQNGSHQQRSNGIRHPVPYVRRAIAGEGLTYFEQQPEARRAKRPRSHFSAGWQAGHEKVGRARDQRGEAAERERVQQLVGRDEAHLGQRAQANQAAVEDGAGIQNGWQHLARKSEPTATG